MEEATEELKAVIGPWMKKVNTDVQAFYDGQKTKHAELQARLLELEQKAARPRGGDLGGDDAARGSLGDAAEGIILGMKAATSARVQLSMSAKALISGSADGSTYVVPTESLGAVSTYHAPIARLVELLPSKQVVGNKFNYVRVDYAAGSPAGNQAAKVAEGALKPASSVDTELVEAAINTYAHWTDASKQILDDVSELQGILDGIMRNGLLDVVDKDIYSVLTTVGNFRAFTPTASETIGDGVARIAAQIAYLGGQNIVVALNPANYLTMQLTKASTAGTYLGLPPNMLASRIVAVPAVATGKLLAFAPGSGANWANREGINLQVGLKDDDFVRNLVTLLCEGRGAPFVRDEAHVAFGDAVA